MEVSPVYMIEQFTYVRKSTGQNAHKCSRTPLNIIEKLQLNINLFLQYIDLTRNPGNGLFRMREMKSTLFSFLTNKIGKLRFQK